jgi:hypothetical protein
VTSAGTCADCGATDQVGSFCDRCGAVLSWSEPAGPVRPPHAEPPEDATTDPLPEPVRDVPFAPVPERAGAERERARRLLVPVPDENLDAPAPQGPTPVLPGRPEPARPHVRTGGPEWSGGGVPCPWCDTLNPPDRRFCRQCAMRLVDADKDGFRTRTWWQRLFEGAQDREAPWAGERPRLRRARSNALLIAVLVILGVPLLWTAVVKADDAGNAVVDHFVKRVPMQANASSASHSDPNHGPRLAFDGLSNTFWGNGYGGGGQGVHLEASFTQPRRLLNVIITSGISKQPDRYATQARPQILDATVFSSDGTSRTTALHLDDAPGPQKLKLRGNNVVRVRLTIRSAYGAAPNRQVCIAEVEFFTRSTVKTL